MSRVSVDDRSSLIKYTGWWEENSVAHSAWDYGSQAKFTFKGTSVFVYGDIPDGDGETVRVDFSIDGGRPVSKYHTSGDRKISNVVWWESGALSDGQHTVIMTYLAEEDMDFRLDRIEYVPSAPQQPVTPTTSRVNIVPVVSTTTTTRVAIVTQTSTSSHVEVVTGTSSTTVSPANLAPGVQTSTTSTSTSTSPFPSSSSSPSSLPITTVFVAPDGQTITQTQYLPAASVTDASSGGATVGDGSSSTTAQTSSGASKTVPVGAIVGGVIGSLAFLALYLILFIVVRRKRIRRREIVEYGFAEGKGVSSTNEQMPQSPIGPFVDPAVTSQSSQAPVGLTSKATILAQGRAQIDPHGRPMSSSDATSDMYAGYSEAGHTVVTEVAPAYASGGPGPDGRFRENFASEAGTIRTWSSGVAEASNAGSSQQFGQPPAYR